MSKHLETTKALAVGLKSQGFSYPQVITALADKGTKVAKDSIRRWIREAEGAGAGPYMDKAPEQNDWTFDESAVVDGDNLALKHWVLTITEALRTNGCLKPGDLPVVEDVGDGSKYSNPDLNDSYRSTLAEMLWMLDVG